MNLFVRTVIIYFLTLIAMRVMGKREIGELTPFDLVVSLMIAELGVILIEKRDASLMDVVIPLTTLVIIEVLVAHLALKSTFIRKIINGTPTILIKNGKIDQKEMVKTRYSIHDLTTQLRGNSIFNISDVEFAILETSGELTVIPKSQKRGLTPEDLGISTMYEGMPTSLIIDGKINYQGLKEIKLDEEWLLEELKKRKINDIKDVLLAVIETDGNIYISTR